MRLISLLIVFIFSTQVFAECRDVTSGGGEYLRCLVRGETAREILRETYHTFSSRTQAFRLKEQALVLYAWEFVGDDYDCAAKTDKIADMVSLEALKYNLNDAQAVCAFHVNKSTGKIEKPFREQQVSSGGISNDL